jgi:ATP-binding cassette, subfamily B, bacterial
LSTNKNTLKLYWKQVRKYKIGFFVMLICIPSGVLLIDTLLPFFLAQAIGGLSTNDHDAVRYNLIIGAGVGLFGALINFIGFQAMSRHEADVRTSLGNATFESVINKDLQFFVNTKVGALTSRFIDFVRSETVLQDLFIIRTLGFILSVGVGLTLLAFNSLPVAGFIAFLIIALLLQVRWSIKKRAPWRHERKELIGEIHGRVADAVTNNLIVKTFPGEQTEIAAIKQMNSRLGVIYKKDIGFISAEGSTRVTLMIIVQIVAISVAAQLVFHDQLAIGAAIFTLAYLQRIGSQLFVLGEMLNGYDQALLEAAPMSDILMEKIQVIDNPKARTLQNINPTIDLQDVSYHYNDSKDSVIDTINLSIPAGQKVGLVGHSGAGKTTITHLLLRFADVTNGSISIDGHDIRDITQRSLREHIAYVPQEPMLFHRSLRENIAYGKLDASDKEIKWAAEQANALDFIEKLPESFDTKVGERGVKLSGGQRQRVAIARAILKNAPILVLDEATSALDSESEKLIQDALSKLMEGRTSIVIAHRLSTIAKLDRIIVLDSGKVVEDGTHTELLKQKGIYANLWAHQSNGLIEE